MLGFTWVPANEKFLVIVGNFWAYNASIILKCQDIPIMLKIMPA